MSERSPEPTLDIPAPKVRGFWQRTPRRDPRTLARWLAGALPGGAAGVAVLLERLGTSLAPRRHLVAAALVVAHLRGDVRPRHWARMGGAPAATPEEIDEELERVRLALVAAGLVGDTVVYRPRGRGLDRHILRRWALRAEWFLATDDEDLLLFDPALFPWLLEAAAQPRAEKREMILATVAHAWRDRLHAALFKGEDHVAVARAAAEFAAPARAIEAEELAAYLERLGGYAGPAPTDAARAAQLLADVARCSAPPAEKIGLVTEEDGFGGWLVGSFGNRWTHVSARGELRVEGAGKV